MVDPATKALLQVARDVPSKLELDEVLRRVLTSARALTEARYAALGVLDDEGYTLARFLTEGMARRKSGGWVRCRPGTASSES